MKADTHRRAGRAAFRRELMVSPSPLAAPRGGPSVNYIQLNLCTDKNRVGSGSPPQSPPQILPDIPTLTGCKVAHPRGNDLPTSVDVIFLFLS